MMATYYPPVGFHFSVRFLFPDGEDDADMRFQTVSGLDIQVNTESIREGGENRFEHALPLRTQYSNLILRRGLLKDSKVVDWCLEAFKNLQFEPVDMTVSLLNTKHEPLMTWNIVRAWPLKWSVSEFNAEQSALVIETLELKYNYFTIQKS